MKKMMKIWKAAGMKRTSRKVVSAVYKMPRPTIKDNEVGELWSYRHISRFDGKDIGNLIRKLVEERSLRLGIPLKEAAEQFGIDVILSPKTGKERAS